MNPVTVRRRLDAHLRGFFAGHASEREVWPHGPMAKLMPDFHVLKFAPGPVTGLWTYCSVGAWGIAATSDASRLEFLMMSATETPRLTELVTMLAYYHRDSTLGWGHTLGLGEPWLPGSLCDSVLLSQPYPFGPHLEVCEWDEGRVEYLWALPITQAERALKVEQGVEALEASFERASLEYSDVGRPSVV